MVVNTSENDLRFGTLRFGSIAVTASLRGQERPEVAYHYNTLVADSTTPRVPVPPTYMGRPRSSGRRRSSTEA